MTKLEMMIESEKNNIEFAQEEIDSYVERIKDCVNSGSTYDIAASVPSYARQLQEAMDKQKAHKEKLQMLMFLEKEEA